MKKLVLTTALLATTNLALAAPQASQLIGTWNCSLQQSSDQMSMALTYDVEYAEDRQTDVAMVVAMEVPAMNESIKVGMSIQGTWALEGDELINTTESWDIKNLGEESAFAEMAIQQFEAQQQQGAVSRTTILELTDSRLVEQPQNAQQEPVVCTR